MNRLIIDNLLDSFDKKAFIDEITSGNNLNLELHYSSCFENAKTLRSFVEVIFSKINVGGKHLSRFVLATDEMNNNAIEYGSKKGDINILRIMIQDDNDILKIVIEVEDTGKGKNHKTADQMNVFKKNKEKKCSSDTHSIRGRGLFIIILNIVDKLYFNDSKNGGLIVGVKKDIIKT